MSQLSVNQERYLQLLLESGALAFGSFKTKSGRISPYFFNSGRLDSAHTLGTAAEIYATLIAERFGSHVQNLFGPAYKGIPLAVMTAFHLSRMLGRDISFTFNRKEAKTHGEGGQLVGHDYQGGEKVVVVEDVITGGTSFRETLPLLQSRKTEILGVAVGVDRQERGEGQESAMDEIKRQFRVDSVAIVTVEEVVERLYMRPFLGKIWIDEAARKLIGSYREQYGSSKAQAGL